MPTINIHDQPCVYETEGDGFPLVLVPDPYETMAPWLPIMPLLGELCKVTAYAYSAPESSGGASKRFQSDRLARDFLALLDVFDAQSAYVAAAAPACSMIMHVLGQAPTRLEGLMFIGKAEDDALASCPAWRTSTMPRLILVGQQAPDHCRWAARQVAQLTHCRQRVVPSAGQLPLHEQPHQLGHMMMQFLLHCERQRNLVRGASFLL